MQWGNIFDICVPYPELLRDGAVDQKMKEHNFTVLTMFTLADRFYQSIGEILPLVFRQRFDENKRLSTDSKRGFGIFSFIAEAGMIDILHTGSRKSYPIKIFLW